MTITFAVVLQAILQYGPSVIPLIQSLVANIEAGKANQTVTAADLAELVRLQSLTSAGIDAREGVTVPPPAPPEPVAKAVPPPPQPTAN